MNTTNSSTASVLNDLIETCRDGQEGFRVAAEDVKNAQLKALFTKYSEQRVHFVGELQSVVERTDKEPATESSFLGELHRGWINLKSALAGGDEHAILAECERGEDSAVAEYRKALEADLPANAAELVRRQAAEVQAAHDRVRDLRDAAEAAKKSTNQS